MAKKARKKSKAKTKKQLKKRSRKTRRKTVKRKTSRGKISRAYHTVVDTIKGTDRLRNRLEQPGTSESE
jgi:hypothetical protein